MGHPQRRAFTLIELLVVIAIIAVLLAILTPAMDLAIYHATLAVCQSHEHAIAAGALTYAFDSRRFYPYRPGVHNTKQGYFYLTEMLTNPDYFGPLGIYAPQAADPANKADDRIALIPYMSMKLMSDPLSPTIDLSIEANPNDSYVMACPALRFGWQFAGEACMSRIGSRWTYDGRGFSILASDRDECVRTYNILTTHPDRSGWLVPQLDPNGDTTGFALSRWIAPIYPLGTTTVPRGKLDMNFAYEDGSARRFSDVGPTDPDDPSDDERFVAVPRYNLIPSGNASAEWVSTPRD